MNWYNLDEFEIETDDLGFDGINRRFTDKDVDQPSWSPIRRKDKMRPEGRVKLKTKNNHRKIQQRIKYELYEAINQKN